MKALLTGLLLFCALSVIAATNYIACDFLTISNYLATQVSEGETVIITDGSCTISNTITTKAGISFHLKGMGTNATTLISGNIGSAISIQQSSAVASVSDLGCVGSSGNVSGFFSSSGPIHYYNLKMTNVMYRGISLQSGLVDHCYFRHTGSSAQSIDFRGNYYGSWANSIPFGTTNAAYVEDCVFDANGHGGNGYFDAYYGAQLVFRHNTMNGYAPTGVHGYDSGNVSGRSWEVYNNTVVNCNSGTWLQMRGGTGVIFSNSVSGTSAGFGHIDYYRSCLANHAYIAGRTAPGQYYVINFVNDPGDGYTQYFDGQPTNGTIVSLGQNKYGFTNSYYNSGSAGGFDGGWVVIGSTVAETITNFAHCVNLDPIGKGTNYAAATRAPFDLVADHWTTTNIYFRNALDGTNAFGYPANQQTGFITSQPITPNYTNFVNVQEPWPAYCWSNTLNGVSVDVGLADNSELCDYNITNLVQLNRDYFNGVIPDVETYAPLVYPHPLQENESGGEEEIPPPEEQGGATTVLNVGTLRIGG